MNALFEELSGGLSNWEEIVRLIMRLLAAAVVGAVVGFQRERVGKAAGLRTHMLVAMGSALFVIGCSAADFSSEGMSRAVQGIATGIGFIGAGAILKLTSEHEIKGLTTAASVWMTAAAGTVVGLGRAGLAFAAVVLTWIVLTVVHAVEPKIRKIGGPPPSKDSSAS